MLELDGVYELEGIEPLQSNPLTQTDLSPYVNGSTIPLGKGYILVMLHYN